MFGDQDATSKAGRVSAEALLTLLPAAVLVAAAVFWSTNASTVEKTDFSLMYVGAKIVHQGLGAQLYDMAVQRHMRDSLFRDPNPLLFEHPPFEALLLSPLAALPFRTAYMIWGLFNATVWLLLVPTMRRYLTWPAEQLGYVCLWLLFAPIGVALFQGQTSILVLCSYSLAYIALRQEKYFSAGVSLGLGLLKFQFVVPFALIFLVRRKWRFLMGFLISCCALGVLSFVAVGRTGIFSYVRMLTEISKNPENQSYGSATDMPTIYGFIHTIAGRILDESVVNIAVMAFSVGLLIYVAHKWRARPGTSAHDLGFGAAVAASLLAGSHMFTHDFSPLLLGLFLAMAHLPPKESGGLRIAAVSLVAAFWSFPIYFLFVAWHCLYLMCPLLLMFVFVALLIAGRTGIRHPAEVQFVRAG